MTPHRRRFRCESTFRKQTTRETQRTTQRPSTDVRAPMLVSDVTEQEAVPCCLFGCVFLLFHLREKQFLLSIWTTIISLCRRLSAVCAEALSFMEVVR